MVGVVRLRTISHGVLFFFFCFVLFCLSNNYQQTFHIIYGLAQGLLAQMWHEINIVLIHDISAKIWKNMNMVINPIQGSGNYLANGTTFCPQIPYL
jgi:hypothetical protein